MLLYKDLFIRLLRQLLRRKGIVRDEISFPKETYEEITSVLVMEQTRL